MHMNRINFPVSSSQSLYHQFQLKLNSTSKYVGMGWDGEEVEGKGSRVFKSYII